MQFSFFNDQFFHSFNENNKFQTNMWNKYSDPHEKNRTEYICVLINRMKMTTTLKRISFISVINCFSNLYDMKFGLNYIVLWSENMF